MRTTSPRRNIGLLLGTIVPLMLLAGSVDAEEPQELQDKITNFNVITGAPVARSAWPYPVRPSAVLPTQSPKRSVGSALSPTEGIGPGESVALTWDDAQYTIGQGRHIAHSWNESEQSFDVHFGYVDMQEVQPGQYWPWSGYNLYTASVPYGDWPRGQNDGCQLQVNDSIGWGGVPSLDIRVDGLVVMAANSVLSPKRTDGTSFIDNKIFFQYNWAGCYYDVGLSNLTWIDSTVYRQHFLNQSPGYYSRDPQVVAQWDGSNTIVHLLLIEDEPGLNLSGSGYCDGIPYYACTYFRKVGDQATGTWSSGQIIDSLWFPWASMTASPYNGQAVVTYTNPTPFAGQLENPHDLDVWLRESNNYGLTWGAAQNITNYDNQIEGGANHFTAWLETQPLYSTYGTPPTATCT
jgi:hypothetical protein